MSTWPSRPVLLDASLVEGGKRTQPGEPDDEPTLVWTYLVGEVRRPSGGEVCRYLSVLEGHGFLFLSERGRYRVYPADVGGAEEEYVDRREAVEHLARRGGGVLLAAYGVRVGFVCDPHGATRAQIIKRARLADEVSFGEYALWMPSPAVLDDETSGIVERAFSGAVFDVEEAMAPSFGYAIWTDDMATVLKRWPIHRQVKGRAMPSEVFWYQYFGREYAGQVVVDDYRIAGLMVERRESGALAVRLGVPPVEARTTLSEARRRWRHSLAPAEIS